MAKDFELPYRELLNISDRYKKNLMFKTTEEIECSDRLVGQERAEKAMEFGINIKEKGYNIYISGENGSGRTYYAKRTLENVAVKCKAPDDWCYVFNFENKYEPVALSFQAGTGKKFKQDIEYFLNEVIVKIPNAFNSEEYDKQKNEILEDYHDLKNEFVDELNAIAESNKLQLKATSTGFAFIPLIDGKPMSENEYDTIDVNDKESILRNVAEVRAKAIEILRKLKTAEKETDEKVKKLDKEVGQYVIESILSDFKQNYESNSQVMKYLNQVKKNMLENLQLFINDTEKHSTIKEEMDLLSRYKVNLIVDNSETKGAPVIFEESPTFNNLMGTIEYESKQGNLVTDFLMIRSGDLLRANGGYLIVKIEDVLSNFHAWDSLKRVLNSNEIRIEGIRSQLDLLTVATIKPQPIPVDIKIILIGSEHIYQLLYELDKEFKSLFKIKVDFDTDMEKNDGNIYKTAQFLSDYCRKNNIRHLDSGAFTAIIDYSSRLSGSNKKISTCFEKIVDLINESNIWAGVSGNKLITRDNIKKAVQERKKRINLIEDKLQDQYKEKKIMLSIKGEVVGQVNGLSVIEIGGYSFGKPYRITASTFMGKSGIINIEREAQMSGNIHNKSIMIIAGYLGSKYAQNIPLSVTANICFEQLYGFIDGDSASIAELCSILSSLSRVPLKQCFAVTGSLNQMGEVQPVGGINEKVEGFYKVCSAFGLDGSHGVIMPYQNIDDLLIDDDIAKDIKNGLFHIYTIKNIEEGIEILTGMSAGKRDKSGEFEKGTFNYFVDKRLKEFIRNYSMLDSLKQEKPEGNNNIKK